MFEHFTFGTSSKLSHLREEQHDPSPTDITFLDTTSSPQTISEYRFPDTKQLGLSSIISQFDAQSLTPDLINVTQWNKMRTSGISSQPPNTSSPMHLERTYGCSAPLSLIDEDGNTRSSCRRLQRQLNVQMQASNTHIRDIGCLVEGMISSGEQCRVVSPTSVASPHTPSLPSSDPKLEIDPDFIIPSSSTHRTRPQLPNPTPSSTLDTLVPDNLYADEDFDEGFNEDYTPPSAEEWDVSSSFGLDATTPLPVLLRATSTPIGIRKSSDGRFSLSFTRSKDVICLNGRPKIKCQPRMRKRDRRR